VGACFGLGQDGPVELGKVDEWYRAAKDCDLGGHCLGDAPRGQQINLTALFTLGPKNDHQVEYINSAASDYRVVRREMGATHPRDDEGRAKAQRMLDVLRKRRG